MMGTPTPICARRSRIFATAAAASASLTVMRTSSEPGARQRLDLLRGAFDVRRVGIGHRLDDDRRVAADGHAADLHGDGLAARVAHSFTVCTSSFGRRVGHARRAPLGHLPAAVFPQPDVAVADGELAGLAVDRHGTFPCRGSRRRRRTAAGPGSWDPGRRSRDCRPSAMSMKESCCRARRSSASTRGPSSSSCRVRRRRHRRSPRSGRFRRRCNAASRASSFAKACAGHVVATQ